MVSQIIKIKIIFENLFLKKKKKSQLHLNFENFGEKFKPQFIFGRVEKFNPLHSLGPFSYANPSTQILDIHQSSRS